MLTYERFYRSTGINRAGHLINPLTFDADSIKYPINTDMYYYKVSNIVENVGSNIPVFSKLNSVYVKNYFEYNQDVVEGNFNKIPFILSKRIDAIKGNEKKFIYLKPNIKRTITKKHIVIHNYEPMTATYRYIGTMFTNLHKFTNLFNTVIEDIKQPTGRNKFLIIDLPDKLPKLVKMDRFCTKLTPAKIKLIPDYRYYTLFELWKFINPNMRETSIFNKIPVSEYKNITLLFYKENKVTVFNFSLFKDLIKEYKDTLKDDISTESFMDKNESLLELFNEFGFNINTISKEDMVILRNKFSYKAKLFKRIFYFFIYKLITKNTIITDEVKDTSKTKTLTSNISELEDLSENDFSNFMDSIIEENIPEYNSTKNDIDDALFPEDIELEKKITNNDEPNEDNEENYEDIEDRSIEAKLLIETNTNKTDYINLDMVLKEKPIRSEEYINNNIDNLKEYGLLSKNEEKKIKDILSEQKRKTDAYGNKLEDVLYRMEPSEKTVDEITVKENNVVFDKSFNKNTINSLDKSYIDKSLNNDRTRTIYALQNYNNIIESHTVEKTNTLLDHTETHIVKIRSISGTPCTLKFSIPVIEEDGSFKMSGNRYLMRKQRTEIPIKKISPTSVVLNSYYGKIFISKAIKKKDDYGFWLSKILLKMYEEERISILINGSNEVFGKKLPLTYSQIGRYVIGFIYGKYNFNFLYKDRSSIIPDLDIDLIEKNNYVICGHINNKTLLLMDYDNFIYSYNIETKISTKINKLEDILEIDTSKSPIEYTSIKIGKNYYPVVLLLSYYIGLEKVLNILNIKYKLSDTNIHLEQNEYKVKFKDKYLICKKDNGLGDIIAYGLNEIENIDSINFDNFNNKNKFNIIFSYLNLPVNTVTEIKMLETMFVDPMTRVLLEQLKEPETFKGLLIRASELLLSDNVNHPNDMSEQCIKGYERLNGMLYNNLVKAIKEHENRTNFSRSRLTLDPYIMLKNIKEDNSTVLIDDLNPLAMMKQSEDVTYLGQFGRSEITMTKNTRIFHESEAGVISEAVKDNGSVGITAYLCTDPKITSLTGLTGKTDKLEYGNMFSTSTLLSPFGLTDDGKRLKFRSSSIVI